MSKIIQIKELYDYYHNFNFGYIGMDLETKKIRYYSHYNSKEEWNRNSLYEFDPNSLENNSSIAMNMDHCKYKNGLYEKLPDEFEQWVKSLINWHRQYNINNNYPVQYIDQNMANLSIQYQSNFSLFSDQNFAASYTPVENIIGLTFDKSRWNMLSSDEKNSLIHEIGHMKSSSYELDDSNNLLIVKTGFYLNKIKLIPIILENKDVFYKTSHILSNDSNDYMMALEEIINDLDCSLAFSTFNSHYPKLGERLNNLCDQKLTYARYNVGIEQFYMSLQKIIDSRDLVNELLQCISDSICLDPSFEGKAIQLIKKYEDKKFG